MPTPDQPGDAPADPPRQGPPPGRGNPPGPTPQQRPAAQPPAQDPQQPPQQPPSESTEQPPPLTKPLTAADADGAAHPPTPARSQPAAAVDEPSLGQLVSTATESLSTIVRSEIELAKLELRSTVKNAGTGAGMFAAALVVLVFSLTFGFIALAEGIIALGLARWLGYLIVFAFFLLVVGALVFLGIKKIKKVRGPQKTIKTTKETVDYLKSQKSQRG